MGSGSGKARRALGSQPKLKLKAQQVMRAPVPDASGIAVDEGKWDGFVASAGLSDLGMYSYYLGDESVALLVPGSSEELLDGMVVEVVGELFADAVSVGAIVLPYPYNAADVEFRISPDDSDDLLLNFRGNSRVKSRVENFAYSLSSNSPLGSQIIIDLFYDIQVGIRNIIMT